MKKFTGFLEKYLSPLGAKLGNQRHLQALSNGMMMTLPLLVIGSIFMILNNPPINLETVDMCCPAARPARKRPSTNLERWMNTLRQRTC